MNRLLHEKWNSLLWFKCFWIRSYQLGKQKCDETEIFKSSTRYSSEYSGFTKRVLRARTRSREMSKYLTSLERTPNFVKKVVNDPLSLWGWSMWRKWRTDLKYRQKLFYNSRNSILFKSRQKNENRHFWQNFHTGAMWRKFCTNFKSLNRDQKQKL